jgi:hypothetical protein
MGRAVIVPTLDGRDADQWERLLAHCRQHGHKVAALTREPAAAVALVAAGHADLVVATTLDGGRVLEDLGARVVFLFAPRNRSADRAAELIRSMRANGGDPVTIARLLGVDVAVVDRVLGRPGAAVVPGRRPEVLRRAR